MTAASVVTRPSLLRRAGRTLAAQGRSFEVDLPLGGIAAATLVLSASIAASIPADVAGAPDDVKMLVVGPLSAVIGVYAAVMAAIYGSFRYTLDRRSGVVAQRATLQSRPWALVGRVPFTALGGAMVAAAAVLGGRLALVPTFGLAGVDLGGVLAILAVGAAAAVWGLGVGLVVQAHLPALFVAPFSISAALMAASPWPDIAAWMPLPTMLRGAGLDLAALGVGEAVGPTQEMASALATAWVATALAAGAWSFLRRDVR
ncbi:hypothetical protein FHS07_000538 [Microbacterium proteolyticum]|uniref:ABC-2 type transport system permease protein n=1 Tax=Microbacterium proteolyticum TaxID=1572644 RepID=A0A7W5CGI5_9MICO|nr:hypothetical protein [Microbacterium proteolyticum]MBB3156854.1 hypothetical protein [Microbacterium proteolyticum]